jgi:hypothetical protein
MFSKRIAVLVLALSTAGVPAASVGSPTPKPVTIGEVQGGWCLGTIDTSGCVAGSDHDLSIFWNMEGTWEFGGKTVPSLAYMAATGTKIGPKTYRLDPFRYDVYHRRTKERIITGWCSGVATMKALITINLECSYIDQFGASHPQSVHVRAVDESRSDGILTPLVSSILELLGLTPADCVPNCPAPFDGVYY